MFKKIAREVPQIVGLKDTSYNVEQLHEYVHKFGDKYIIAAAGDSMMFVAFVIGAQAHISGISNLFPELAVDLYNSVKRGDLEKAKQLQSKINDIKRILKKVSEIAAYKAALKLRGINAGIPYSIKTVNRGRIPRTQEKPTAIFPHLSSLNSSTFNTKSVK